MHKFVKMKIPWLKILKDRTIFGLIVGHIASEWGFFLFLTCLPMYMQEVLKFNIISVITVV